MDRDKRVMKLIKQDEVHLIQSDSKVIHIASGEVHTVKSIFPSVKIITIQAPDQKFLIYATWATFRKEYGLLDE